MSVKGITMENNIISAPPLPMPALKGLGHTFFHKMKGFKNAIAQTEAFTGEQYTYEEIFKKSLRCAIEMRARGLKPKDVFMLCSVNHMDLFAPYYAGLFLGAIPVSIDPMVSLSDAVYFLNLVKPKMLFVGEEGVKLAEDAVTQSKLDILIVSYSDKIKNHVKLSEFLVPSQQESSFQPHEVEDLKETATIVFTSGSTGLPKAACLTHHSLLATAWRHSLNQPVGIRILVNSNLYWISQTSFMTPILLCGCNRIIYSKHNLDTVWDVIHRNKINIVCLNAVQMQTMLEKDFPKEWDMSHLKYILVIGGTVEKTKMVRIRARLPDTVIGLCYGQTELSGSCLEFSYIHDIDQMNAKPTSVGRPKPGYEYKIVDTETGKVLGPNEPGELLVKTENSMNGFYNMDSSDVWNEEGYIETGDVLYYDEDYCFYFVDRIRDMMKYKMWHISPAKIENVLLVHPAVEDCVVSSIEHEIEQDLLVGVVKLKKDYIGKVTEREIQNYVDEQMDDLYKLRGGVKFVESIPYTITGKPNRRLLRQRLTKM